LKTVITRNVTGQHNTLPRTVLSLIPSVHTHNSDNFHHRCASQDVKFKCCLFKRVIAFTYQHIFNANFAVILGLGMRLVGSVLLSQS